MPGSPSSRSSASPSHFSPRATSIVSSAGADAARLIEAGQAAERSGHRSEARENFESALYSLQGPESGNQAAALLRWIGRSYMMDANSEAALDCAEAALAVAQAHGDRAAEGHAINLKAAIYWAQSDLDAAESLFREARTCALGAQEKALVAMTSANLGTIANIRGDLPEALHHYSVGIEHYRALGRLSDVVVVLNNMGRLYVEMKRWLEAERAYAEAIAIDDEIDDLSARIGLEVNIAEMWIARGDAGRAREALEHAARISAETGDEVWLADIAKLNGILRRDAGATKDAEQFFGRAVELAEARQDVFLLAETLRERATLYRGEGRNREALQNLNRAHRLFEQLRAKRALANVDSSVSRLENDFINVVERWGESIEAKDHYTQGHCVRVADLSCAIAKACGIEGQALFWFRVGAMLHDVGKLVVPSEVLNKPGKLDENEWKLMRSHPSAGVDMLAGIDFPGDVRPIIESHHERWDGKGYPHGLAGEDIPLPARILAVADVYDALTSIRSYKKALSHEAALEIMRQDSGTAFDPAVFAKFEDIMRGGSAPASAGDFARSAERGGDPSELTLELTTGDPVTGLPTRPSMQRMTAQAMVDRQTTRAPVSILVLEIDVTSAAWQRRGDAQRHRVLRWTARELRNATRTSDFVARTGDHQFMTLLPGSSARQANAISLRVRAALSGRLNRHASESELLGLVRLAVVSAPGDGESAAALFAAADGACAGETSATRAHRAS
jgi:diguanylate cyclase (GGDEF)-like protein/putative nucleotidyltransferase with HDIG domain